MGVGKKQMKERKRERGREGEGEGGREGGRKEGRKGERKQATAGDIKSTVSRYEHTARERDCLYLGRLEKLHRASM